MILHPLSDVHTEWSGFTPEVKPWDSSAVLMLAGDIGIAKKPAELKKFMKGVTGRFRHIFYIPGNHEFYGGGSLVTTDQKLEELCADFADITYLNNKTAEMDDVCFIGTTLWTDFAGHLRDNDTEATKLNAQLFMNDYSKIRTGSPTLPYQRKVRPHDMETMNFQAREFLQKELKNAKERGLKTVVMTHHAPLHTLMPHHDELWPCYYNTGFEDLFENGPDVWIHGHTHHHVDQVVNATRLVCNPRDCITNENHFNHGTYRRDLLVKI